MCKCVVILVFSEDIHFLKNHCGQGQDEPDWPCLCVWGPWFALGTLPCLSDLSAHTYSRIGGQIRCCCLSSLRWVSRSAEGWPESCFCRNLLKLARSFALDISGSGHQPSWALNVPGFIFSKSFPECFGLQFLSIYLLSMFSCFQGVLVSNLRRILLLICRIVVDFFSFKKMHFPVHSVDLG